MSKTRQVLDSIFSGEALSGRKGKKQYTADSNNNNNGSLSVSDFASSGDDSNNSSSSSSITSRITATAQSLVEKFQNTFLTRRVITGVAITTGVSAAAGALYVSSLRSQAEATWSLLLSSTQFSSSAGGKHNSDAASSSSSSFPLGRMHLFYADPAVSRQQQRNRSLHTATQAQQPLTVNLAAALFLKECEAECRRRIRSGAPIALFADVARSAWDRFPQWMRLQLWHNWMREQQQQNMSNKNNNLSGPKHVVVVITEHARLPSTFGALRMANRVVEVGFSVLGEVSVHAAVENNGNGAQQQQRDVAPAAASALAAPSTGSSTTAAVVSNPATAAAFSLYLRLFFHRRSGQPLQNLLFSDCAGPGDATKGEDPQDIRVSAPSNLGIVTIARYASTSTDDAPFPLVSVEEHARISLLPPFQGENGSSSSSSNSTLFPASANDPPDVLVQKTRFRRAVQMTVFRRALDTVPATVQRYDRTAAAAATGNKGSPTSSLQQQQQQPTAAMIALSSAFVVISVSSNVAARVTSCQLDRHPLDPLSSQEQTAAVVRKLNTTNLAAQQGEAAEAQQQHQRQRTHQHQQQQRGNVTASMGVEAGQPPRVAGALKGGQQQQHFVFPIVRPTPAQLVNRLEKTAAEQQQHQQQQQSRRGGVSSPTTSTNTELFSSAGLTVPDSLAEKRRVFPLTVEFEFEHKQYVPRRAMQATGGGGHVAAAAAAGTQQKENDAGENVDGDDDDDTGFGFVTDSIRQAAAEQQQAARLTEQSVAERRRQQQRENQELSIKASLVWCAVGEPPSGVHVKRAATTTTAAGQVQQQQQQQQQQKEEELRVRVLRETWYTMDVPISF